MELLESLATFTLNGPASSVDLQRLLLLVGPVPDDGYVQFIKRHDGGAGIVSGRYLELWPIREALKYTANCSDLKSSLFLFATDGSDTAYAFDRSDPSWPVMTLSLTSASPEDVHRTAGSFAEFLGDMVNPL